MSLINSPLTESDIPAEIRAMYLSHLSLSEQCKARRVCKRWSEILTEQVIWKPVFRELNPFLDNLAYNNTKVTQTEVLADLQKHQKHVDLILSLIDTDPQLELIIDCSSMSLIQLNEMLPIERSLHVMRGLKSDCTQLFVYLAKKPQIAMRNAERAKLHGFNNLNINDWFVTSPAVYDREDPCLPLLLELINSSFGPYNVGMTMSGILPLARSYPAEERVMTICASMIKSHPNLSDFFKTDILLENEGREQHVPVETLVREVLMPGMERYRLGVKIDDWVQCGLLMS